MISKLALHPTLPAADIKRARKFYADKLGLDPEMETPEGGYLYKTDGSWFTIYPSKFAGTAKNTAAEFETDNLEREMKELRSKGVIFEEYDMPGFKTINGVLTMGQDKASWFKDSEGNILALTQIAKFPK
jgi:catechol 2,3-dioxygenase-like lactoylglutathione lyase family enzyme